MVKLVICLFAFSAATSQILFPGVEEEDNSCTTPHDKEGKCVGLKKCGYLLSLLKKPIPNEVTAYLRKSVWSSTSPLADVCYPEENPVFGEEKSPTLVKIPSECGVSKVGQNRIVNGRPAGKNAWPWIAALGYKDPNTGKVLYMCGATLITSKHVLTAAHCVRDDLVTVLLGVSLTI